MWASAPATVRPLSPILRCASSRRRRCARGARPNRRRLPVLAPPIWERRLRLAQEAAVPPYVIFHDATLAAMAAARPATEEELLALPGVGEKKLATYGKAFLEEIASVPEATEVE